MLKYNLYELKSPFIKSILWAFINKVVFFIINRMRIHDTKKNNSIYSIKVLYKSFYEN